MPDEPYVLYIEDERPVLDLVCQALKRAGYQITGLSSGAEGLAMMRKNKPALLLLDLMMPGLSGWDVYREMKADEQLADIRLLSSPPRSPKTI
jgi:DNA-binding response OmpR family regulator